MTKKESFNFLTNNGLDKQAVEFLQWQDYFNALRMAEQETEEHF